MSGPDSVSSDSPLAARGVALQLLGRILRQGQTLDDALGSHRGFAALAPRDRAFVRLLLATCLRRKGEIDAVLAQLLERGAPPAAAEDALRLGATQLLFLATPAHAAVDTTVELVADAGLARLRGLVNALMRRIARERTALLEGHDAARLNMPDWLWQSWCQAYGEATTRSLAAAHLNEAPLDLTAAAPSAELASALQADIVAGGTLRRSAGGQISELPGFAEGRWWVQDAAAALPVRLLGEIAGKRAIDLCAAPGGKTLQLCAAGARVTAVDISARRLERLRENLARCQFTAELITADAGKWQPAEQADIVLLDAPCSATGTLRRHPDIAWLKGPGDIARLGLLQERLLQAAAAMLGPQGVLIYAVCSLQPEEGPGRIAAALAGGLRLKRLPFTGDDITWLPEAVTPEGDLRLLPSMLAAAGGLDGFYIARLVPAAI